MNMKTILFLMKLLPKSYIAQQARHPQGLVGHLIMAPLFEAGNKPLLEFMLTQCPIAQTDRILDVGFGPGTLFEMLLAAAPKGKLSGIDISIDMVKRTATRYSDAIKKGQLELRLANIESIPYSGNTFDKVYTANTIYFWHHPIQALTELYRIMKPGGSLIIGFRTKEQLETLQVDKKVFSYRTTEDVVALLKQAHFKDIRIHNRAEGGQIPDSYCAVAIK